MTPLRRYRLLATLVGLGLIILVFVAMPLRYIFGIRAVSAVVGPLHGFLYIVYLVVVLDVARVYRLSVWRILAMVGAGLVPFLAFYVERRISRAIEGEASGGMGAGPARHPDRGALGTTDRAAH